MAKVLVWNNVHGGQQPVRNVWYDDRLIFWCWDYCYNSKMWYIKYLFSAKNNSCFLSARDEACFQGFMSLDQALNNLCAFGADSSIKIDLKGLKKL